MNRIVTGYELAPALDDRLSDTYALRCASQFSFQGRRDAGPDRFDGPHQFRVWQRRRVHLKREPRDPAERLAVSHDLLGDFLGIANQQRSVRPSLRIEPRTGCGWPATLLPHIGKGARVAREELVGGFLRRLRDVPERMDADLQAVGRMSISLTGFPIQI